MSRNQKFSLLFFLLFFKWKIIILAKKNLNKTNQKCTQKTTNGDK